MITLNLEQSLLFSTDSFFNASNLNYARNILAKDCNRFPIFHESNLDSPRINTFDNFVVDIKNDTDLAIVASDGMTNNIAKTIELDFQLEFRDVPPQNGILNFNSQNSAITGRKEFIIRTFNGTFSLQKFVQNTDGIQAIPELLTPPYEISEYAAIMAMRPDFIYISSTSPMSMKAAIFVLANQDQYTFEKINLVKINYFYKTEIPEELNPYKWNVSVFPMASIKSNTP